MRPEPRNWEDLPADVTSTILTKIGALDVLKSAELVCKTWLKVCRDPAMWRNINLVIDDLYFDYDPYVKICRHLVDRSEGQLLSISLQEFATNELLRYVADKSRNLRKLRLVACEDIWDEAFSECVKAFSLLEDLELSYCNLSHEALEAVGRHCPLLKSLKFNGQGYVSKEDRDKDAVAISENMPGLHNLQLFGNKLTNIGLQAILDGCPHLESLDLRRCFKVSLVGDLGKLCAERIKDVRYPNDSTHDYEFNGYGDPNYSSEEDYACDASDTELAPGQLEDYLEFDDFNYDYDYHYDLMFDGYDGYMFDDYDGYMFNDDHFFASSQLTQPYPFSNTQRNAKPLAMSTTSDLKLFVSNLHFTDGIAQLAALFRTAGNVEKVVISYDELTGTGRGFGFVTMSSIEEIDSAVQQFNGYELMGRPMRVNSGPPPRREEFSSRGPRGCGGGGAPSGGDNRVYVGNLSWGIDDLALERLFSKQGKVVEAKVIYDRGSGRSRGFGFVTYSSAQEVANAIDSLNGIDFGGRSIRVSMAEKA